MIAPMLLQDGHSTEQPPAPDDRDWWAELVDNELAGPSLSQPAPEVTPETTASAIDEWWADVAQVELNSFDRPMTPVPPAPTTEPAAPLEHDGGFATPAAAIAEASLATPPATNDAPGSPVENFIAALRRPLEEPVLAPVPATKRRQRRHHVSIPRRSTRLAAKSACRDPVPERQGRRVLLSKWSRRPSNPRSSPDSAIATRFRETLRSRCPCRRGRPCGPCSSVTGGPGGGVRRRRRCEERVLQ